MSRIQIAKSLFLFFILTCFTVLNATAQCDPLFDPNCEDPDTAVPLDDYVPYLIGAGIAIGAFMIKKVESNNTASE
ncbi:MAG: hypothetical protein EOO88_16835 [Pedobacter sp.]|nr:MAG: hypothetical protein EOO88_16835 [Pedobacter sp.]